MTRVTRNQILDYQTYADQRDEIRDAAVAAKADRRIVLNGCLCFLFENWETTRYQVQEMMRTECIVREADIQHEIDTYNDLLGGPGELGCSLLIGIDDPAIRDDRLRQWLGLNAYLYLRCDDGSTVRPTWDPRQCGEDRLSSVQYLKFPLGTALPVVLGCDLDDPMIAGEVALSTAQQRALSADLEAAGAP